MEGRVSDGGGCCISRYTHNHHAPSTTTTTYHHNNPYYYDGSKIDHIMLRFRPIAPKPVVFEPSKPNTSAHDASRTTKGKRKATNTSSGTAKKRKKSRSRSLSDDDDKTKPASSSSNVYNKVTLPLLPETPDLSPRAKTTTTSSNSSSCFSSSSSLSPVGVGPTTNTWLCFGNPSSAVDEEEVVVVGSSVIIEGVTDTWVEGNSLGTTNEEKRKRLDWDTCPGFISDGWNRVCWTNKAFRKMVGGEEDTCRVKVKLGKREKVELPAVELFPAFTCRVKVQYGKNSMTVPCDAWGLHGGGFAWRLDINAALCLGR